MIQTFKNKCDGKVSVALQAMIDGLHYQSQRKDFKIAMKSFGDFNNNNGVCYGCAATCAVQKLSGVNFCDSSITGELTRAKFLDVNVHDLKDFEDAIDSARNGYLYELFVYMDQKESYDKSYDKDWELTTRDWGTELPKDQTFVNMLKSKDN